MKLLLIALMMIGTANASTINSLNECTVDLYKSNPWKTSYIVKGSRTKGLAARSNIRMLLSENAALKTVKDELGVSRYTLTQKKSLLDQVGKDAQTCGGIYRAMKVETCTADSQTAVCETSCELSWRGMDCR